MNKILAIGVKNSIMMPYRYRVYLMNRQDWCEYVTHCVVNIVRYNANPERAHVISGERMDRHWPMWPSEERISTVKAVRRFYMPHGRLDADTLYTIQSELHDILIDELSIIEEGRHIFHLTVTIEPERKYESGPSHEVIVSYFMTPSDDSD